MTTNPTPETDAVPGWDPAPPAESNGGVSVHLDSVDKI